MSQQLLELSSGITQRAETQGLPVRDGILTHFHFQTHFLWLVAFGALDPQNVNVFNAYFFITQCASGGRTDLSSWPVGHLMESQHGLVVIQWSPSMACWSSDGASRRLYGNSNNNVKR